MRIHLRLINNSEQLIQQFVGGMPNVWETIDKLVTEGLRPWASTVHPSAPRREKSIDVKACLHLIRIWSTSISHLNPLLMKLDQSTSIASALMVT